MEREHLLCCTAVVTPPHERSSDAVEKEPASCGHHWDEEWKGHQPEARAGWGNCTDKKDCRDSSRDKSACCISMRTWLWNPSTLMWKQEKKRCMCLEPQCWQGVCVGGGGAVRDRRIFLNDTLAPGPLRDSVSRNKAHQAPSILYTWTHTQSYTYT